MRITQHYWNRILIHSGETTRNEGRIAFALLMIMLAATICLSPA